MTEINQDDSLDRTTLGFWIYLMTDCLLFLALFLSYAVLHQSTFGGPSSHDLFHLSRPFVETLLLLFSSAACGFALIRPTRTKVVIGFSIACLFGISFVAVELGEFSQLVQQGYSWKQSAFLSSFFALVGVHGLHVSIGLLWMLVMMVQVVCSGSLSITTAVFRRLLIFSMFWHFLDVVWIFIFTFVYLIGVV